MSYLEQIIRNLDEEGRHVFQGMLMTGYTSKHALLNAYGVLGENDYYRMGPWTIDAVRAVIDDDTVVNSILSFEDSAIEAMFWKVWENA